MDKDIERAINKFVDFLIIENCEGCKECEPRLSEWWNTDVICKNQGQAAWFREMADRFIKGNSN